MFQTDTLLIGILLPIEAVTFYAIAANLARQASGLTSTVSYLIVPRVSALASLGSSEVGKQILTVGKATTLMVGPVVVTFILRGESFIDLWMGPEYGTVSGQILAVLAVVVWFGSARAVATQSLIGLGKQRVLIPGFMAEAVTNVALSIALVQPLGVLGVAVGTLVPNVAVNLGYLPRCLAKVAGFSRWHFYRDMFLLPAVSCVPFALGSAALERFLPATSLVVFFLQVIVLLPLVPAVAWFTCLSPIQREQMAAKLKRLGAGRSK
jgi:O-antigen/teichoic acid export membrane protein